MQLEMLKKTALILAIIVLSCVIIVYGKSFLIPVVFAGLLASLLIPIASWLQKKGFGKALSILSSELLLLLFFVAFIALVTWQISDLSSDASNIEKQFSQKYQEIQEFFSEKLHIPKKQQDEIVKQQQSSSSQKLSGLVTGFLKGMGGFATDTILVLVYIFLFLYFRETLQRFIIRMSPEHQKENAADIIYRSQKVTQKYLTGLALMILSLWIMYSIGFSIAGVKSPVFFAMLCGILEIVPFVGNLVGTTLTILISIMQGGDTNVIVGILITYGLVQFFQTYILEPLVVGAEVNLNPLFTILALVAGEMLWGVPGMILAIPLMGVTKIVCDHIEPLKPFGELIGGKDKKESGIKKKGKWLISKIKLIFKK
jgi:predicted PurR-regulated permease PerM